MFERPDTGERAVLVHLGIGTAGDPEEQAEFRLLAEAAGAQVTGCVGGFRRTPDPRLFIGCGKADELRVLIETHGAELVIFNHGLSPAQERNLERHLRCRVVDRTGLILDIFAQRARSFEGKLQVELAQLRHLSTRLVRGWTHLERQKGGIGLRGPGETQLESDRRLIGKRISQLNQRLERITSWRAQGRPGAGRADDGLAGRLHEYRKIDSLQPADSGHRLSGRSAVRDPGSDAASAAPLPGATLILADTVGFISHLPHELVAAFRSTLEETRIADLLLHVVDASDARRVKCIRDVEEVLSEIGVGDIPQIQVFNKIDLVPDTEPRLERDAGGRVCRVWISARSGAGIDLLHGALGEHFHKKHLHRWILVGPEEGALRAWFFTHAQVLSERTTNQGGWEMEVMVPKLELDRLLSKDKSLSDRLVSARGSCGCRRRCRNPPHSR